MVASKKQTPAKVQAIISAADAELFATTASLAEDFLNESPDSLRGWLDLGHALTCLCRYEDAIAAYQKAIALADDAGQNPDGIYSELGQLHRQRGDFAAAAECFQKQIDANPDESTGYMMKATLELQNGQAEQSIETLGRALECSSSCPEEVHYSLGISLRSAGRLTEARDHLQKAISLVPDYAAAKTALKDVKSAISASP